MVRDEDGVGSVRDLMEKNFEKERDGGDVVMVDHGGND